MHRFIDQALLGLADRREDNGEPKVTEQYEAHVFAVVPGSPRPIITASSASGAICLPTSPAILSAAA